MPICIDRFSVLSGAVIAVGWSSDYRPGDELSIVEGGEAIQTITLPVKRPDLIAPFGEDAADWGFRAYGISPGGNPIASEMELSFRTGAQVTLGQISPPVDDNPHGLWGQFIEEVNASGGTVLEIGSRARSGNSSRELFKSSVRYIGVDITAGENVDVVADAHHLSDAIRERVDFIFSISTFEHFLMPWKAALEMNSVLRPGGKVFTHSHQTWPGHDEPWDYFRFSREAWSGLFNRHTGFRVLDSRRGEAVSVISRYNIGGPYEQMEHSPGWAMSVCLAQKVAKPQVRWNARVSDLQEIEYTY